MVGSEERAVAGKKWLGLLLKQSENLQNYFTLNHTYVTLTKAQKRKTKIQRKKKGGGDVCSELMQLLLPILSPPLK